jgi:hypothetical protein
MISSLARKMIEKGDFIPFPQGQLNIKLHLISEAAYRREISELLEDDDEEFLSKIRIGAFRKRVYETKPLRK